MAEAEFQLSSGRTIKIQSVSPFFLGRILPTVLKEFEVDTPPTYIVELVGGDTQEFTHDETTLEVEGDPEQTEHNFRVWSEYKSKLNVANLEANRRWLRALLEEGVVFEMPEDEDWLAPHKRQGIEIPEDPIELRLMYIQDVLIKTKTDWNRLVDEIVALSDITEEDVAAATESF
jgi:hypothetical protein